MDISHRYRWAAPGDLNAFFGLCVDNLAGLVLTVSLLATVFGYPAEFALRHLVPGTAVGVVVGDVLFTWMAFRLARRTGRTDVTAMPLGLDTPSTFGMVFLSSGRPTAGPWRAASPQRRRPAMPGTWACASSW
jgi:AGZA family xanthine/uracil permease-like MFS transporter